MNETNFESPDSNTKAPLKKKGSAIKAIIVALLVDFFGLKTLVIVLGFLLSYITGIEVDQIGYKMIEIGTAMQNSGRTSQDNMILTQNIDAPSPLVSVMVFVLICHVLGGYLCARIANNYEYRYSAIVGFFACIFWVIMNIDKNSIIENIICTALIFAASLFGAFLHVRNKTNNRMKPTTRLSAI